MHEIPGDHPRVGGEKIVLRIKVEVIEGSPPRGRGKVDFLAEDPARAGITPAWAGKSARCASGGDLLKDHPRVGGEKCYIGESKNDQTGSPPRGRGKATATLTLCTGYRITPAWAGKSHIDLLLSSTGEDHPRVGGEKQPFGTKSVEK